MNRPLSRLPRMLFASTIAVSAAAAAAPPYVPSGGTTAGHRTHKPITLATPSNMCAATTSTPTNAASDPEEGGQVNHAADATQAGPINVASDPEEGGQVTTARTVKPKPKPTISEINVTNRSDKASPTLAEAAPPGGGDACAAPQQ